MKAAQRFEDLIAWQRAHRLVFFIYKSTKGFLKTEVYGLVDL